MAATDMAKKELQSESFKQWVIVGKLLMGLMTLSKLGPGAKPAYWETLQNVIQLLKKL